MPSFDEKSGSHDHDEKEQPLSGLAEVAPVTQAGVLKVAAATRVWTPVARTLLFIGVGLVAYVYSLDGTTTYLYVPFATSSFSGHSLLAAVGTAQAIILAVMKPPAAKIADVFGRAEAYCMAVVLYTVGYIIIASSKTIDAYAGGAVIYSAGSASIQIIQQIVIADCTSLRWRGFVSQAVALPFFINAFVASNIGAQINAGAGWRWGYGMFAILIPVCASPIILVLAWGQRKAKKLGVVATDYLNTNENGALARDRRPLLTRAYEQFTSLDLFGLLLFAAGWSLLLLPLTLTNRATLTWQSGKIIAMIVIGVVLLIAFVIYEWKFARLPIVPFEFFKTRTVLLACIIALFDFVSFYLQFTYQYSFIYITKGWSPVDQNYFAYTQTLSLTFFGCFAGLIQLYTGRLKLLLIIGLAIRLLGVGLMIYSKGAHGTTAGLVMTQVLQGMGGGIAAASTQTAVQAAVSHQQVAGATAVYLLFAEIGNAIGTAIAGAVWRNTMPTQLTNNLAGLVNSTTIDTIYGSITTALTYEATPAIYDGIIRSYDTVMLRLLIAATCLSVVPFVCAFFIADIKLTHAQNALEDDDRLIEKANKDEA